MKSDRTRRLRVTLYSAARARRARLAVLLATAAAAALLLSGSAVAAPAVSSVSDKLICLCGCNSVLSVCPHTDCAWGIPAKQDIEQQLDSGKTPDQVIAYYVAKEGEQVLASPTKTGFNMVVWVLPFVVLIVGAGVVYYLVRSWAARKAAGEVLTAVPVRTDVPEDMQRRLEDELRKFD